MEDGQEYNGDEDDADIGDGDGEHLGVGEGAGERPAKVLHGKGTDCWSRPDWWDQYMIGIGMLLTVCLKGRPSDEL